VRWRLRADWLAWHDLDGEIVIRSTATGSTHLLDESAGEVFRLLSETKDGLTLEDLAARLTTAGLPEDECYPCAKAAVEEFQRLGLAETDSIARSRPD